MSKKLFKSLILTLICYIAVVAFSYASTVDKIIVVVNGETVTQAELDAMLAFTAEARSQELGEGDLSEPNAYREEILNKMIEELLILSEAKKRGITAEEDEIEKKLNEVKSRFDSETAFKEALREQDLALTVLKQRYADQIMSSKLIDMEVRSRITVTPSEILQYYELHKEDFKEPEQVSVRNILIKPDQRYGDQQARIVAEKILGFLKAGESFNDLALKYSKGPNADRGGDLGFVKRGQMLKVIEDVIFDLDAGQLSEVIETNLGYHIFKVEEKRNEKAKALSEVSNGIEQFLYLEKVKPQYRQLVEGLKKNAYISFR
ncbi:MAG: peptidylprolyl isomerase [Candidatus Omnitrophica bacterium]|nr:peptidylprolyl isomerase [Candidatus Omnitrophota bacterium]